MGNKQKQSGLTLLELIIVLVIAGILAAVAIPSFILTIRNNRLATYSNDVVLGLMTARSEAIKRNSAVIMCRSNTAMASPPACTTGSGTGGWDVGWFIYIDADANSAFSAGDTVVMQRGPYTGGVTMLGTSLIADQVRYNAQGLVTVAGNGSITLDDGRPACVRTVAIAVTGRPRISIAGSC